MPAFVYAKAVNWRCNSLGFDAIASSSQHALIALADGANSCHEAGQAAQWMVQQWVRPPLDNEISINWEARLLESHQQMQKLFPETACTLAFAAADNSGLTLGSVGDSYAHVFWRSHWPWSRWQWLLSLPRDLDAMGHPSQLVGSEILLNLHRNQLPAKGRYIVVLMSDGAGGFCPPSEIEERLCILGRHDPGPHDLGYFCESWAQMAHDRGSHDDISVIAAFCPFT